MHYENLVKTTAAAKLNNLLIYIFIRLSPDDGGPISIIMLSFYIPESEISEGRFLINTRLYSIFNHQLIKNVLPMYIIEDYHGQT